MILMLYCFACYLLVVSRNKPRKFVVCIFSPVLLAGCAIGGVLNYLLRFRRALGVINKQWPVDN